MQDNILKATTSPAYFIGTKGLLRKSHKRQKRLDSFRRNWTRRRKPRLPSCRKKRREKNNQNVSLLQQWRISQSRCLGIQKTIRAVWTLWNLIRSLAEKATAPAILRHSYLPGTKDLPRFQPAPRQRHRISTKTNVEVLHRSRFFGMLLRCRTQK